MLRASLCGGSEDDVLENDGRDRCDRPGKEAETAALAASAPCDPVTHSPFPWSAAGPYLFAADRVRIATVAGDVITARARLRDNLRLLLAVEQMATALVAARHALQGAPDDDDT